MRRIFTAALLAVAASTAAFAQEFKPIPNPPMTRTVAETLRSAGNFKTFLSLLEQAGLKNLGLAPAGFVSGPGPNRAATAGFSTEGYRTIFAPNDAAFAKLPKGALAAMRKDPARLRSFLLGHMVEGKVMVADVLTPVGDGTSRTFKELKSRQGQVLGFSCDGHTGLHMPRINGRARVGKFQDVMASDYLIVIHEIDTVLFGDGSV
ncbi:MAG: fasciclin domain-containing protein [Acidobacteria bacterium]|nr:fasciclin domain-containing protein [Acidobacteriota bacterium]